MPTDITFEVEAWIDGRDVGFTAHATYREGDAMHSIVTQGDSFDELRNMIWDAVHLDVDGGPMPRIHWHFTDVLYDAPRL